MTHIGLLSYTLQGFAYSNEGVRSSPNIPRTTILLVGFRRYNSLEKVKIGFRVDELLEVLDLQTSIFIGDDVEYDDHFTTRLHPN